VTEPSDALERKGARPVRDKGPSLLELALAVYHGEISEGQAIAILRGEDEEVQTSDA